MPLVVLLGAIVAGVTLWVGIILFVATALANITYLY